MLALHGHEINTLFFPGTGAARGGRPRGTSGAGLFVNYLQVYCTKALKSGMIR